MLSKLKKPLRTVQDIEKLKLGRKTKDKLIQVLTTGYIHRNVGMADDAQEQLLRTFSSVWGAGEASSRKWIAAGCRSLEDVQRRTDLTEIQRVGLRYYEDFQQRIPRSEVEAVYSVVRKTVIRSVARLTHMTLRRCESQARSCLEAVEVMDRCLVRYSVPLWGALFEANRKRETSIFSFPLQ